MPGYYDLIAAQTKVCAEALKWRYMRSKVIRALEAGQKIDMKTPEWDLGAAEGNLVEAVYEYEKVYK
jgi:hypothetical protein